jgi:transposase InsO family protein
VFSGLINLYPVKTKDAADTEICIRDFIGDRKSSEIKMYSDQSGEIRVACTKVGILHDKSQPGVPQTNALIERTNQLILTKTIVALLEAGLPPCYWSFAAPCTCFNLNTDFENGDSAWALTHGEEIQLKRFPFGCKVLFKPSSTKSSETDGKWSSAASVGVFAGYMMHPGYKFKGEYLVWDLLDFGRGADLSNLASHLDQRLRHPHVSVRCEL